VQVGASGDEYADTDPSALTEWKPVLENHGTWVDDATYGTVWVPSASEVGSDFQPYVTAGRWTYSDTESWVWVSDYDWGWVPFHYGRWVMLPGHGWSWIPGRTYSGAWVTWRTGPVGYGYVGWAPAAPDWYWYNGYAVGWGFGWYRPYYVYCPHDYMYRPGFHTHVVRGGTPAAAPIEARTQPYQPATPGVGGTGRVVATPGVGGPRGPRPTDLGMKSDAIPAPPAGDRKLARAQAFATPSTARTLGAAPPAAIRPRPLPSDAVTGDPGRRFGPSVGASRLDPVARAPQVQGVAPRPSYNPPRMADPTPYSRPSPGFGTQPSARAAPLVDHWSRPSVGSTPSTSSQFGRPSYRPSPSTPSFRPSMPSQAARPSSPTFQPSPSSRSSFGSSSPSRPSSPSFGSRPSVGVSPSRPSSSPSRASPSIGRGASGGGRGGRR
jgi:hypothetical protein